MEQYSTIDAALAELKDKYERPVVVEQFTNPKPAVKKRGASRIFVNQTILCMIIIAGLIACKFAFPEVFNSLYEEIIKNVSNSFVLW